jgi:hypothetical protein
VDFNAEELACRAEIPDLIFLQQFHFDFNCGFGSSLWVRHGDIVDRQMYQNATAAEIEVVEEHRGAFFLHGSFPVTSLKTFHSFLVGETISSGCGCH